MRSWRPQQYQKDGEGREVDPEVLRNALLIGERTVAVNPQLPPIFTLRHLSYLSGVEYGFLRGVATRELEDPYTVFRVSKDLKKTKRGFRIICIPDPDLMSAQRWIAQRILRHGHPHFASVAYSMGNSIKDAAAVHCGCRWLIKCDVRNFFESISEIAVYRVFLTFGYQPLVAFELTRLCTRLGTLTTPRKRERWKAYRKTYGTIQSYRNWRIGHLPQGAPTSPMLSNLAMITFDKEVARIATNHNLIYTCYADDVSLSSTDRQFGRQRARHVIGEIYRAMGQAGLSPNVTKTRIVPPGARKLVLGLLVDGNRPRLTREFRAKLRQHIYYLSNPKVGPAVHASKRGFTSVWGLRNYIQGLIAFVRSVDPELAERYMNQLRKVAWPV